VIFGFIQAFTYAEIAGLFPNKSGGASVYSAAAWVRYSKFIAPLSVWCNWLAWTPVLAIGCGIAAGYILYAFFAPDAAIRTWEIQLADLGFLKEGLKLRLNSTFFIGATLILISFAIQHRGTPTSGAHGRRLTGCLRSAPSLASSMRSCLAPAPMSGGRGP